MTRRKFPRYQLNVPLEILSVDYQPTVIRAQTHDISTGGVRCLAEQSIAVGTIVDYRITLSANQPAVVIQCKGIVLRSGPSETAEFPHELVFTMRTYHFAPPQAGREVGTVSALPAVNIRQATA